MIKRFFSNIISATLGLCLSILFIPGVVLKTTNSQWKMILILGAIVGLINLIIRPIINTIALPPRKITLGLLEVALTMAVLWLEGYISGIITIPFWVSLLEVSLVIWIINFVILKIIKEEI